MKSKGFYNIILMMMFLILLMIAIHFIAGRAADNSHVLTGAFVSIFFFLLFGVLLVFVQRKFVTSERRLSRILDSTTEAIIGLDLQGFCTFANKSSVDLLGYQSDRELIGRHIHDLVHRSNHNTPDHPASCCEILLSLQRNEARHLTNDVFWNAGGRHFPVDYRLSPKMNKGKITGAVITFIDMTESQRAREREQYFSCHDPITGLYNQAFMRTEIKRLDVERNLPISMIVGDVNGLKLTNDVYGHEAGDELLKMIGSAIKRACRADDIISRISGDEFVILLPRTSEDDAAAILKRIQQEVDQVRYQAVRGSIALGQTTKSRPGGLTDTLFTTAEEEMYQNKIVQTKHYQSDQLHHMIQSLHRRSEREKLHSENVSRLCSDIAAGMKLSRRDISRIKDAGYYHDIGKVMLSDAVLANVGRLSADEQPMMQRHSAAGYRILNLFHETMDIAQGALDHHERWDGGGYPKGLKGEEISLPGRIIAVAEAYDAGTNPHSAARIGQEKTLEAIRAKAGFKYDPQVVDALVRIISTGK